MNLALSIPSTVSPSTVSNSDFSETALSEAAMTSNLDELRSVVDHRLNALRANRHPVLQQLRSQYPSGCLCADLVQVQGDQFIVRAWVQVEGVTIVTALASATTVEVAEDRARSRVLESLGLTANAHLGQATPAHSAFNAPLNSTLNAATSAPTTVPVSPGKFLESATASAGISEIAPELTIPPVMVTPEAPAEKTTPRTASKRKSKVSIESKSSTTTDPSPAAESTADKLVEETLDLLSIAAPVLAPVSAPVLSPVSSEATPTVDLAVAESVEPQVEQSIEPQAEPQAELQVESQVELQVEPQAQAIGRVASKLDLNAAPEVTPEVTPEVAIPEIVVPEITTNEIVDEIGIDVEGVSGLEEFEISYEEDVYEYSVEEEGVEAVEPVAAPITVPVPVIDLSEAIAQIGMEIERIGWTKKQGSAYLQQEYGKRTRAELTEAELFSFLGYLKSLPAKLQPTMSQIPF